MAGVLSEIMTVQLRPICMLNLNPTHKPCSIWDTCMSTDKDYHLIFTLPSYYDQALEVDPAAKLPVSLALAGLWIRRNYANSFLVDMIDSLPEVHPKVEAWLENVIMEEGNATILTLFVCLLTVLYLRARQRRQAAAGEAAPRQQPFPQAAPVVH